MAQAINLTLLEPTPQECVQNNGCRVPEGTVQPYTVVGLVEVAPEPGVPLSVYVVHVLLVNNRTGKRYVSRIPSPAPMFLVEVDMRTFPNGTYTLYALLIDPAG